MKPELDHPTCCRSILVPGRNCWTADAVVQDSGLLIDGRDYYRAFYHAARQARRYILIAGWKFNSDVRLLRGQDAQRAGGEVRLLPFLQRLCEENPELRIHILAWDFSPLFTFKWEWFLARKFSAPHGRLQFRFDDQHALGGCHHQKFAVVDGRLAFVGGLDLNADDWDDREHRPHHPDRADAGQEPHGPYHDIQAYLSGPGAEELTGYFKARWEAAGNEMLELPSSPEPLGPTGSGLPLAAERVALSRTHPQTVTGQGPVYEIEYLYRDAIASAEELIYIENQYFSSQAVCQALLARMRDAGRPQLDIVLILPRQFPALLEEITLGPPRLRVLDALWQTAQETGHHLGVYYTAAVDQEGQEIPVVVHSKLLVVDDRFLTVGSANTSNRSMGVDTELNVSWEATGPEDEALARSIRAARVSLLAEHCGLPPQAPARSSLEQGKGLVEYLDLLTTDRSPRLRRLTREAILEGRRWLGLLERWGIFYDPVRSLASAAGTG